MASLRTEGTGRVVARLLVAALVLGIAAMAFEEALLRPVIGVFRAWLDAVDTTFHTVDLRLEVVSGELLILRIASPPAVQVLGGHVVTTDPGAMLSASASAGIVLQPLILGLAMLAAWPARRLREFALRMLVALPLLALVVLLDIPLMLYGFLWNQEIRTLEPDRFSPLISWSDFMNAGGRFALTVGVVAVTVALVRQWSRGAAAASPQAGG